MYDVSIHALLAECDNTLPDGPLLPPSFNPRTPCGVRPEYSRVPSPVPRFQSTHSLRSATVTAAGETETIMVSIHALLAECDGLRENDEGQDAGFNPRTPCGVRPPGQRKETLTKSFNPRTPCGVRPHDARPNAGNWKFQSTHSLRSATHGYSGTTHKPQFQSTHSLRSATTAKWAFNLVPIVSIHALLAECDLRQVGIQLGTDCFNPRTPCGVRPFMKGQACMPT